MGRAHFVVAVLLLLASTAGAQATKRAAGSRDVSESLGDVLVNPRPGPDGGMVLNATERYLDLSDVAKANAVRDACAKLRDSSEADAVDRPIQIYWRGGGSVQLCRESGPLELAEWDDLRPARRLAPEWGRLYVFGGGQLMLGNGSMFGVTASEGAILAQNHIDFALSEALTASSGTFGLQLGLSGRYRYPLSDIISLNAGGQVGFMYSSSTSYVLGLLAGVGFLVPGGSIDATFNFNKDGDYGIVTGYTLFIDAW
jgi:hypothetical protein